MDREEEKETRSEVERKEPEKDVRTRRDNDEAMRVCQ